jgi:hypothetical protein
VVVVDPMDFLLNFWVSGMKSMVSSSNRSGLDGKLCCLRSCFLFGICSTESSFVAFDGLLVTVCGIGSMFDLLCTTSRSSNFFTNV